MIIKKIKQLVEDDGVTDWREATKYSKALTTSFQHRMQNGESAALLDFMPWKDCNEDALVQNYVDSVPLRKTKKKRRECPVSASVLFRNGGPEVTGKANMQAIKDYEKAKAAKAAEKIAKKMQRTHKRAEKRQDAVIEVVNMVLQELLLAQTPPLQFRDDSGVVVSRPLKPDSHACKQFMQVWTHVYYLDK